MPSKPDKELSSPSADADDDVCWDVRADGVSEANDCNWIGANLNGILLEPIELGATDIEGVALPKKAVADGRMYWGLSSDAAAR